jgi:ferredoxin-NADP reductase/Na+-translocating ferredoxin:NAD+ oxidoreductase RnfD subunit
MVNQLSLIPHWLGSLLDRFNDKLTSYRLMLYYLLALAGWAIIGSFFHQVPYAWHEILVSVASLMSICWVADRLVSRFLGITVNNESSYITAVILALILPPPKNLHDFALLVAAAIAAIASKYILAVYRSHFFNPAAVGAFISGEVFHKYPSWWIGTKFMVPLVFIGGVLVMRKMQRFTLVSVFLAVYLLYLIFGTSSGGDLHFLWNALISTPVLFFAYVMLIEPQTSPTAASRYIPYAILVGLLYSVTKFRLSPEEALLIGGVFTLIFAHSRRYKFKFLGRMQEAAGIYSYAFELPANFNFKAGQYMEWTVKTPKDDLRGNRRYLTISSSPSENGVMFTIKQPDKASAFKQRLANFKPGDTILASHVTGSFTLPKDPSKKIAFMGGGIGITPFRSMIKYLLDNNQSRDISLLYSASNEAEFSFRKLFEQAKNIGLKTIYATDSKIDSEKIRSFIPDFKERVFFISGPYGYVQSVEQTLLSMGVKLGNIVTDYFPGYG